MRDLRAEVQGIFDRAAFIRHLGIELVNVSQGSCETRVRIQPEHGQQHGHIHAGVITTLADHTAGGSARAAVAEGHDVLTIEFKINFLRPGSGAELRALGNPAGGQEHRGGRSGGIRRRSIDREMRFDAGGAEASRISSKTGI
jgi:uncharacterized protein (TIGR00369 family)